MLETVNDLIASKKNPALAPVQMLAQLQYVFTPNNLSARTRIDEIEHRLRYYPVEFAVRSTDTLPVARLVANALEVN